VVRKAKSFINKYPYSLVASSADHLITVSRKAADEWYRNLLQQVDQLAAEKRYQEALLLIERVPRLILPVEKQQELAVRSKELSTTEAINRETTQLAQEQQAQENWNTGMTALEAKEYDQAIEAFTRLLGTSYDVKARKRIDEAAGLAAQEDRRRAAELFVRSGRTHDLMSRKKLLLASRQLLQDILIKYPQSDLTEKVKRNLKRIDEEINAIDPTLLAAPVTVNGQLPEPVESSTGGPLWKDGRESGVPPAQAVKSQSVTE
jgi:outer membrane protein assembly factor BamD (BamD/ComL family)